LGAIIEVCARTIVVTGAKLIDGVFMEHAVVVEDLMQNLEMAEIRRGINSSIEKELVDWGARRNGATTTCFDIAEIGVGDVQSRFIVAAVIENNIVRGRRTDDDA
jgi:hypothetical protein